MKLASSIIVSTLTASHHVGAFSVVRSNTAITSINKNRISTSLRDKIFFADEKEVTSTTSSKKDTSKTTQLNAKDDKEEEKEEEIASMTGGAASSMSGSIYDKLGFEEDNIGIGIDPDDVSIVILVSTAIVV